MGSTTAKGYPYPVGTDRVMDGDNAIQSLAEAADTKAGISAAGTLTVNGTNGQASGVGAVVFPAGRFTAAPVVVASVGAGGTTYMVTVSSATATGCNLTLSRRDGTNFPGNVAVPCTWIARSDA